MLFCFLVFSVLCGWSSSSSTFKNVLWLIADDLRPQLNKAYGQDFMVTPELDKFAESSLVFDKAFCNFAICSASRNSFMTGRLPDKTRTWNFINHFRQAGLSSKGGTAGKDWVTLPQLFKNHNYTVLGHGKMYHPNKPPNNDEPNSWSQEQGYVPLTSTGCINDERFCPGEGKHGTNNDNDFSDFNTTMSALSTLDRYATKDKPFFIALGLHFPHQPWATPAWAVEKYPDPRTLHGPKFPSSPKGCPDIAFTAELDGDPTLILDESNPVLARSAPAGVAGKVEHPCPSPGNNTVPMWFQQQLRVGYYSAVTHTDWLFGKVLDKLESLKVANDTLVVLTGDHGWQLGEHAEWGKHTNWDLAVHVPLLIRAPWKKGSSGKHTQSVTELVDLYRTISSLAGLPASAVASDVDGTDVSALLDNPATILKSEAYSQYSRCPGDRYWPKTEPGHPAWYMNNCEAVPAQNITSMGYTVRTNDWRLTEWIQWDGATCSGKWDSPHLGLELYSHLGEHSYPVQFDAFENENVAADPAHASVVEQLRQKLRQKFDTRAGLGCPPPLSAEEAAPSLEQF